MGGKQADGNLCVRVCDLVVWCLLVLVIGVALHVSKVLLITTRTCVVTAPAVSGCVDFIVVLKEICSVE